jgi:hypothetical protein
MAYPPGASQAWGVAPGSFIPPLRGSKTPQTCTTGFVTPALGMSEGEADRPVKNAAGSRLEYAVSASIVCRRAHHVPSTRSALPLGWPR